MCYLYRRTRLLGITGYHTLAIRTRHMTQMPIYSSIFRGHFWSWLLYRVPPPGDRVIRTHHIHKNMIHYGILSKRVWLYGIYVHPWYSSQDLSCTQKPTYYSILSKRVWSWLLCPPAIWYSGPIVHTKTDIFQHFLLLTMLGPDSSVPRCKHRLV